MFMESMGTCAWITHPEVLTKLFFGIDICKQQGFSIVIFVTLIENLNFFRLKAQLQNFVFGQVNMAHQMHKRMLANFSAIGIAFSFLQICF